MCEEDLEPSEAMRLLIRAIRKWPEAVREWPYSERVFMWFLAISAVAAYLIPRFLANHNHLPPVGVYVTIMGLVIAAMSLRKEPGAVEKALWMVLITMLMAAEIRDIYTTAAQQSQTFQQISQSLEATKTGLDAAATTLKEERTQQELRFGITMKGVNGTIDAITGGDSYLIIVPLLVSIAGPNTFRVLASIGKNCEQNRLGDVQIYLRKLPIDDAAQMQSFILTGQSNVPPAFNGVIDPREAQFLQTTITPAMIGETSYFINVFATNKPTIETMKVRLNPASKVSVWF